jgi:hypothetical protein
VFWTQVELIEPGEATNAYPGVVKFSPGGTETINQLLSYTSPDPLVAPEDIIVKNVGFEVGVRVGRVGYDDG